MGSEYRLGQAPGGFSWCRRSPEAANDAWSSGKRVLSAVVAGNWTNLKLSALNVKPETLNPVTP